MSRKIELMKQYQALLYERTILESLPKSEIYRKNDDTRSFENVEYQEAIRYLDEKIKVLTEEMDEI